MDFISLKLFFLSLIITLFCVFLVYYETKFRKAGFFSPVSLFGFFMFLTSFPLVIFALDNDSLFDIVLVRLHSSFRSQDLIIKAYLFHSLTVIFCFIGILLSKRSITLITHLIQTTFAGKYFDGTVKASSHIFKNRRTNISLIGFKIFVFGILVYLFFIQKSGGLINLWLNMNSRVQLTSGLMYLYQLYNFSIVFGSLCILFGRAKSRYFISDYAIIITTIIILASLGQRGPVISYIFLLFLFSNFLVKKVRLFKLFNIVLVLVLLTFGLAAVQFRDVTKVLTYQDRPVAIISDMKDDFKKVFLRFSTLRAQLAIVGYFENNSYWLGSSFSSFISAPIPRSIYPDKPPVDTGMYVNEISRNIKVYPPVPVTKLNVTSSIPEGNWTFYANFGLLGLLFSYLISGYIFKAIYNSCRRVKFNFVSLYLFGLFAGNGYFMLHPSAFVNMLMPCIFMAIISVLLRLRISK